MQCTDINTPLLPNKRDLSTKDSDSYYTFHDPPRSSVKRSSWTLTTLFLLLASSTFVLFLHCHASIPQFGTTLLTTERTKISHPNDTDEYDAGATFAPLHIQKLWGISSPYFSVDKYEYPPKDCRINQVNILQRHGARYPPSKLTGQIKKAVHKLQAAESFENEKFRFLANYSYDLGMNDLLPFGAAQSFTSGRKAFARYSNLATKENLPFMRASRSERIVESARQWAQGFETGSHGALQPPLTVTFPESPGMNNTLHHKSCPNAKQSKAEVREWQSLYAQPIADRLNAGARGLPKRLTPGDVQLLIMLCAAETLAKERYSPFCELFTQEDFVGFEYAVDLHKFYNEGYGAPLGPIQGVGYINELLARLTDQPIRDYTQTNYTLDSNPDTFPFGRGMYVDFSHGSAMVAIISAMGLFNRDSTSMLSVGGGGGILDPRVADENRAWIASKIVPFSAKLVVERLDCGLPLTRIFGKHEERGMGHRQKRWREEGQKGSVYVRILMNDAVQMPNFCEGFDEDGLCSLPDFVKSQEYAREDGKGDWERCFY